MKIRAGLGGPSGGPGGVGTFYRRSGRPSRRCAGDWDVHSEVWEALPEVQKGLVCRLGGQGGPRGGLVRNSKPSRRSGRGQEVLPEDQETFAKVQEGSWSPPAGSEGVKIPSLRFGGGREDLT